MKAIPIRATLAFVFVLACAFFGGHAEAHASTSGDVTMSGQTQGRIRGSITMKGREGQMRVIAISPELKVALDPTTGQATGQHRHKPLRLVIEADQAMPLLMNAIVNNEVLTTVTIRMFAPDRLGMEKNHYTIQLTNAHITRFALDSDSRDAARRSVDHLHLELTYETIELVWEAGGISSSASWRGAEGLGAGAPKAPRPKPTTTETTRKAKDKDKPKPKAIAKPKRRSGR